MDTHVNTKTSAGGNGTAGEPTWAQVQALSKNMFQVLFVKDGGNIRPMDCSEPGNPKKNDTLTCYFKKENIDALFAASPDSDGVLIYFGVSDPAIYPCPPRYVNKLTAILVPSVGGKPNVPAARPANEPAGAMLAMSPATATGGSGGITPDKTCPPDICG